MKDWKDLCISAENPRVMIMKKVLTAGKKKKREEEETGEREREQVKNLYLDISL